MKIEVKLRRPLELVMEEEEIITLAGWDLGFITPGRPLHVLHVEPGAEIAAHGICSNDVLVGVDGRGFDVIAREDVAKALQAATHLSFERTEQDVAMEPAAPALETAALAESPAEAAPQAAAPSAVAPPAVAAPPAAAPPAEVPVAAAPASAAPPPVAALPPAAAPPVMTPPATAPPEGPPEAEALQAPRPAASPRLAASGVPAPRGLALRTGMAVRLKGFETEVMNGLRGRLGKFSEKLGSWQVFLDSTTAGKAVRPQNLEVDPDEDQEMKDSAPVSGPGNWRPSPEEGAVERSGGSKSTVPSDEDMPEGLPLDQDDDAWVELLRDAYIRQLRSDNEYPEPPPYERAYRFAANQFPIPEGMFPSQALRMQSRVLHRAFNGDGLRLGRRRVPLPPRFGGGYVFPQSRML